MILSPDFTMQEECCKVENDARIVFKERQIIGFKAPVFADTINVTSIGTINTILVKGVDWDILESDIDTDTMSRLKLQDPNFDKIVCKSFTFLKSIYTGTQTQIALTYQLVYPIRSKEILMNGEPIVFTPQLAKEMLEDISYLKSLTNPIDSLNGSPEILNPKIFEEDPFKENPDNIVENEIHSINVPENKHFIHPIGGSFFKDSLVVKYNYGGSQEFKELKENEDYVVVGLNNTKTATTPNTSGVYDFIFFITSLVGDISINYHAYGGDPTLYDQKAIIESINNIGNYLNKINAVTPEGLGNVPIFQELSHQVYHLREDMRRLTSEGRASYGDSTSGMAILKKLVAADSNTHWWTIATLYKVDTSTGQSEVITADEFHFRLTSKNKKLMFDAIVSVNLNNESRVMECTVLNDCYPKGYIPFEDYTNLELIPRPQLRIIYNKNDQMDSGIALQLGMKLTGIFEEIVAIEDLSGKESCWKLISVPSDDTGEYQDNIVQLPNEAHVWDKLNPQSQWESTLIPFKKGHLIWSGSIPINRPNAGKVTLELDHFLDDDIDIKSISKARVELRETGGHKFAYEILFIDGEETKIGNVSFMYNGSSAYINMHIRRIEETGKLSIILDADTAAGLSANKLDLCHVFLYS